MAKFVLKDAFVEVDGNDISDHVSSVTIETNRAEVDVTAMGAANTEVVAGLGDATITMTVFQDFGAASLDSILWPLSTDDTPFAVSVRPTSAAVGATNPEYSLAEALMFNYSPIAGGIGDAATTDVTFRNAGQGGLTRAVA